MPAVLYQNINLFLSLPLSSLPDIRSNPLPVPHTVCSQESITDQTWARTCPGDSDGETLSRSCRSWRTPDRADVPTFTHQTTLASQLATPQNWTHYPNSFLRPPITFSIPPSLDSAPTLTDFTSLCSASSGCFSPDIKSHHYLHFCCCATPSILFQSPPLSPPGTDKYHLHRSVPRPPVRPPFLLRMWVLALQKRSVSVDTEQYDSDVTADRS